MNDVYGQPAGHHSGLRLMRNFNKQFNSNHIFVIKEQIYGIHRPVKIIFAEFCQFSGALQRAGQTMKKMLFLCA
jgi:hypothetical protein